MRHPFFRALMLGAAFGLTGESWIVAALPWLPVQVHAEASSPAAQNGGTTSSRRNSDQQTILVEPNLASFDCTKARTEDERLICSDEELSRLDGIMGKAFLRFLEAAAVPSREEIRRDQAAWISRRNYACGLGWNTVLVSESRSDSIDCLGRQMKYRTSVLDSKSAIIDIYDSPVSGTPEAMKSEIGLQYFEAIRLAADAAFHKSATSRDRLIDAAVNGDIEGQLGLGEYYEFLSPAGLVPDMPLILKIVRKLYPEEVKKLENTFSFDPKIRRKLNPGHYDSIEEKESYERSDYFSISLFWYLLAAEDGEPASEAKIGSEYFHEAFLYLAILGKMEDLASPEKAGAEDSARAIVREACGDARLWLGRAIDQKRTQGIGKAFGMLGFMHSTGSWRPTPEGYSAFKGGVAAGCYLDDPGLAKAYTKAGAEAEDGDSMALIMHQAHDEGDDSTAEFWRARLHNHLLADQELGFPVSEMIKCTETIECADRMAGAGVNWP